MASLSDRGLLSCSRNWAAACAWECRKSVARSMVDINWVALRWCRWGHPAPPAVGGWYRYHNGVHLGGLKVRQ